MWAVRNDDPNNSLSLRDVDLNHSLASQDLYSNHSLSSRDVDPNQNGSSLTHYGVKGMRWGVRKELKLIGNRKKKSYKQTTTRKPANQNDPTTNAANVFALEDIMSEVDRLMKKYPLSKDSQALTDSYGLAVGLLNDASSRPAVYEFLYDKTNGEFINSLQTFFDTYEKATDYNLSKDLRDTYSKECVALGDEFENLMNEYTSTHMNDASKEDEENDENWQELNDYLKNFDKSKLPYGSKLRVVRDGVGSTPYIVYTTKTGEESWFSIEDVSYIEKTIEQDSSSRTDYRETAKGKRTREKNVDSSAKPVKVTKGKKIEVSDVERLAKSLSRGDNSKSIKAVNDYLDKNPSLKKEVYEKVETQIQKDRERLINDMKKSRRKSK